MDKIASIKNAKPKPVKEVVTETENFESYVPETVTTPAGALGSQTISELVAMKAKQREQRQIKMDDIIKKNKLESFYLPISDIKNAASTRGIFSSFFAPSLPLRFNNLHFFLTLLTI